MTAALALLAAVGGMLVAGPSRRDPLSSRLAAYLHPEQAIPPHPERGRRAFRLPAPVRAALVPAGVGALAGAVAAGTDLLGSSSGRSMPGLAVLGAGGALVARRIHLSRRADQRARRLRAELPTVAEALALPVLAGASVVAAIEHFTTVATGVAASELSMVVAAHREGGALPEALHRAGANTADPQATRLYDLLGHAHESGGPLADALADLAADYRAALARELTGESGRRALAGYGPILALMVPVTLLFLMYPTLAGLTDLSARS